MKYFGKLIYCEWLKDFSVVKFVFVCVFLGIVSFGLTFFSNYLHNFSNTLTVSSREYDNVVRSYEENPTQYRTVRYQYYEKLKERVSVLAQSKHLPKSTVFSNLELLYYPYYASQYVLEHYNSPELTKMLEDVNEDEKEENLYLSIVSFSEKDYDSIVNLFHFYEDLLDTLNQAIDTDLYYEFAQYRIDYFAYFSDRLQNEDYNDPTWQFILDHKIEDYRDLRLLNYQLYLDFQTQRDLHPIPTLAEYQTSSSNSIYRMDTYEDTVRYHELMLEYFDEGMALSKYASEHNLVTDIPVIDDNIFSYPSAQVHMNQGLLLGIVILFILILFHSSILSNEYSSGTVKFLYTKRAPKWEVLLAKFCYLVLLMYVFWLIGSFFCFLFSGIFAGFGSLFSSKLLYVDGIVIELPYLICYFRELLICSLPVIFFIGVLLMASAFISNSALIASSMLIVSFISYSIFHSVRTFQYADFGPILASPFGYLNMPRVLEYNSDFIYTEVMTGITRNSFWIPTLVGIVFVIVFTLVVLSHKDVQTKA